MSWITLKPNNDSWINFLKCDQVYFLSEIQSVEWRVKVLDRFFADYTDLIEEGNNLRLIYRNPQLLYTSSHSIRSTTDRSRDKQHLYWQLLHSRHFYDGDWYSKIIGTHDLDDLAQFLRFLASAIIFNPTNLEDIIDTTCTYAASIYPFFDE